MTGNLADAQECVQEAYARAWQHWRQVQPDLAEERIASFTSAQAATAHYEPS